MGSYRGLGHTWAILVPERKGSQGLQTIRYIVVLVTGFIGGSHVVDAIRSWQEWQIWAARDPSGAEAYKTSFMANAVVAALSLAIAGLVWWLLRPRSAG